MLADRDIEFTITLGEQTYTPVSYNTFKVGPFSATTTVKEGEDIEAVLEGVRELLREFARVEYIRGLDSYTKALRYNDSNVRKGKGS